MPKFEPEYLVDLAARLFVQSGAPAPSARLVAEALVRADMMGMPMAWLGLFNTSKM